MSKEIKIRDASYFARIIADKEGISFQAAQLFIREFFLLIEKGLKEDNYVHIKDLGSFKRICLESGRSNGITKNELIFVPDNGLQLIINKPFEHFEPVVVSSDTLMEQLLQEQQTEQEIKEVKEVSEKEVTEMKVEEEQIQDTTKENQATEEDSQKETDKEDRKVEDFFLNVYGAEEEDNQTEEIQEEIDIEEAEKKTESEIPEKEEPKQKMDNDKSKRDIIWMFSFVLFILSIFTLLLFFRLLSVQKELDAYINLRTEEKALERVEDSSIILYPEEQNEEESAGDESTKDEAGETTTVESKEQPVESTSSNVLPSDFPTRSSLRYTIVGTMATHQVVHGETLRILSEVYFGSRGYWPYIYYHNEAMIKDPNNIPKDMVLNIPKLDFSANR